MFGDKTVVNSGSLPHAKLHKRHTGFSYQCVHEAIASGMVKFYHIPGDILSKHWGSSSADMEAASTSSLLAR